MKTNILFTIFLIIFVSGSAYSAHPENSPQLGPSVELGPRKVRALKRHLRAIEDILDGKELPPGKGGKGRPIGDLEIEYVVSCHIDNDTSFTWGENKLGEITGKLDGVLSECDSLAKGTYGSYSSSGIKILEVLGGSRGTKTAQCHIDNDTSFTANEIVIGTLAGDSLTDLQADCAKIAQAIYGSYSSSGLRNLGSL